MQPIAMPLAGHAIGHAAGRVAVHVTAAALAALAWTACTPPQQAPPPAEVSEVRTPAPAPAPEADDADAESEEVEAPGGGARKLRSVGRGRFSVAMDVEFGEDVTDAMMSLEFEVAEHINRLRADPPGYAAVLRRYRGFYEGNLLRLPGASTPITTAEGVAAVDEAIAAARAAGSREPLRLSPGLSRAARLHAIEIGDAGTVDHRGEDGSAPHERMARHGAIAGMTGENIGVGHDSAEGVIADLFIDDGVSDRGHRTNLLEPGYSVVGVGCASHRAHRLVCVIDFAQDFQEREP